MRVCACATAWCLQRATVLSQLVLSTFEPGQTIVKQGKQVSAFYIIKEGTVAVKRDNDTTILKELTAGQWFGESEVKLQQVRRGKRAGGVCCSHVPPTAFVVLIAHAKPLSL